MSQKLRDSGEFIAGGVQRLLVHGARDDGIDLAGERLTRRRFDRLRGCAPRVQLAPLDIVVPSADDLDVRVERLPQRLADDFGTNAARIADDHRETRTCRWCRRHDLESDVDVRLALQLIDEMTNRELIAEGLADVELHIVEGELALRVP